MAEFLKEAEKFVEKHKVATAVGVAAVAAVGIGVAAHEHHETEKQKHSEKRIYIKLVSGHNLHHESKGIYVSFHQGHTGVKSNISHDHSPVFDQELSLGVLDTTKPLVIETHHDGAVSIGHLGKAQLHLDQLSETPREFEVELGSGHGTLKFWACYK